MHQKRKASFQLVFLFYRAQIKRAGPDQRGRRAAFSQILDMLGQMLGQKGQRRGHVLVLHENVLRHVQVLRGEIPDRADAVGDQHVADLLRVLGRDGDDADHDLVLLADVLQAGDVHDRLAVVADADQRVVRVERGHNVEPVLGEAAVAQQRAPELAGADQNGVVRVSVAEELLDIRDQPQAVVADLRSSSVAHQREILPHLYLAHVQRGGQRGRRDIGGAALRQGFEIREIGRQAFQRRF
jgi:hypothetical protein